MVGKKKGKRKAAQIDFGVVTKAHREHEFTGELRKMKDLAVNNPKAYDLVVDI